MDSEQRSDGTMRRHQLRINVGGDHSLYREDVELSYLKRFYDRDPPTSAYTITTFRCRMCVA
jgi:hypothetical protein